MMSKISKQSELDEENKSSLSQQQFHSSFTQQQQSAQSQLIDEISRSYFGTTSVTPHDFKSSASIDDDDAHHGGNDESRDSQNSSRQSYKLPALTDRQTETAPHRGTLTDSTATGNVNPNAITRST